MSSILFTDADGIWRLHNGIPFPGSRFAGWTHGTKPIGDSVATLATGALTMFRQRIDYGATFSLPHIPQRRSTNRCVRSADASHATWTKTNITVAADTGGRAPDGSTSSDRMTATATAATEMFQVGGAASAGAVYVISAYVKRETVAYAWVGDRGDAAYHRAWLNLSTGALGTQSSCTARVVYWGNGWYRLEVAFTRTNGGDIQPAYGISDADNSTTATANLYGYWWGQQEDGAAATLASPYLETAAAAISGVSMADVADRLVYHLQNGGTCSVYTNDAVPSAYATCGLRPGTEPQLVLSDRRALEYTLSLDLINVAGSPARMVAYYAEQ